jgi:recombination protein RecT
MTMPDPKAPTTAAVAAPAENKALRPQDRQRATLRNLFASQRPELVKLLPPGMTPERLERMALTECVKNPKLLECTVESWALALQTCAAQGLYPDSGMGFMYLIPSNNSKKIDGVWHKFMEVRAQRGYQGDIEHARRSGQIADIYAEVVYEKDAFEVTKGLSRDILHKPHMGDEDPGQLRATYAVAKLKSGEVAHVVLFKRDVMRHKAAAQTTDVWDKHPEAMWKKSAIRELYKWIPKATEEADRLERERMEKAGLAVPAEKAIDIDAQVLPSAGSAPALDRLAESLAGEGGSPMGEGGTPTPTDGGSNDCPHPDVREEQMAEGALGPGEKVVCEDCGQVWEGPPLPATTAAMVDTSKAAEKKQSGQARLG